MERESRDVSAGRPTGWHGGASEEPESRSPSSRHLWKFLMRQPCPRHGPAGRDAPDVLYCVGWRRLRHEFRSRNESPCCSLRCSVTWYPIRGYQTNSLTTPRTGPERHVPVPNAAHQARMSRTWPGARCTRAASARGAEERPVRMDDSALWLCWYIGPHFIKSGLGNDDLIFREPPMGEK